MHEGFTGRAIAAAVAVGLLGPPATATQGAWEAPPADKERKNPLAAGSRTIAQGWEVTQLNCMACHGPGGKGDGMAASALTPRPADWTSSSVQAESDGELFWKISNGHGAMPAWRHLSDSARWAVVHFFRSLKAK